MYLTCGLPGSGKTTLANTFVEKYPDTVNVNRDDLRKMLFNAYVLTQDQEVVVTQVQRSIVIDALKRRKDVIISDTNLNTQTVKNWHKLAEKYGAGFELIHVAATLNQAVFQDSHRQPTPPKTVGAEVIYKFGKYLDKSGNPKVLFKDFSTPEFEIQPYKHDDRLETTIIVDLDGTVALHNRGPFEYEKLLTDSPNDSVIRFVEEFGVDHHIVFMSGRPDSVEKETRAWIKEHIFLPEGYSLFMRKDGDMRMDAIVKEELFQAHVAGKYNVLVCFDDRDQVVKLWREKGLSCFQVNYGDF